MKLANTLKNKFNDSQKNEITAVNIAKEIICQLVWFACGALFASIDSFGLLAPFGVAFAASARDKYLIASGLGAAAGYILTQDSVSSLRYIAAIVCAAVFMKLVSDFEKLNKFRLLPSCVAFLTCFLTSLAVLLAGRGTMKLFLAYFGEAALSFAAAYFFASAQDIIFSFKAQGGLSLRDSGNISVTLFLLLLSVSDVTVFGFSFARAAAVFAVLFFSYIFKEAGGAVSGISAAAVYAPDTHMGVLAMTYAVAGLMTGVFSYVNRYVSSLVFMLSFGVAYLFAGGGTAKLYLLAEAFTACVAFAAIPEKQMKKAENFITIKKEPQTATSQRQVILDRLRCASAAVGEMSQSVSAAAGILDKKQEPEPLCVYTKVQNKVCNGCRLYDFCWTRNFRDCKAAFDEMNRVLSDNGVVNSKNMPSYLMGCCVKVSEIADCFNKSYINYISSISAQDKIEKIRRITGEQFGSMCSMLAELSQEFTQSVTFDNLRADRIEEMLFAEFSLKPESVVCLKDADSRIKIELYFRDKPSKISENGLRTSLETICGRQLNLPVVSGENSGVHICFCEKTKYRPSVSATRITAENESMCGDSYESFYDGRGNYIVVLSDGMGTGMRAAVDSALASGMTSKLLKSGFSYASSLRLVNSALLLKSKEESLATLDVLEINLYNGAAVFYKAGAAVSFIKRKSKIMEINRTSMPVGILRQTDFAEAREQLDIGDTVIMASDGAFEFSGDAVKNALAVTLNETPSEITPILAQKAKLAKKGKRCDDITVIALRLYNND